MTRTHCPCCHQPLPPQSREGVHMSPMQARIFDAVRDNPGIAVEWLVQKCGITINTVRQHVHQVNLRLEETDIQISGDEPGERGFYRIVRRRIGEVA